MSETTPPYVTNAQPGDLDDILSEDWQRRLHVALHMLQQDTMLGEGGWGEAKLIMVRGRIVNVTVELKVR